MLIAIIKRGGWMGHAQGGYITVDESQATQLISERVAYDGVAFSELTTEEKNAVYAAVPEPINVHDDLVWLFAR